MPPINPVNNYFKFINYSNILCKHYYLSLCNLNKKYIPKLEPGLHSETVKIVLTTDIVSL